MNYKLHLPMLLLAFAATAQAQQMEFLPEATPASPQTEQIKYTLLKPEDKTSETVKAGERNPFGKSDSELNSADQKGTNEENQIRDIFVKLRVVGTSPGANGMRVMLGDMVLEEGGDVPQVLAEQTVMLRVGRITSQSIELIWVEKKPSGLPPRTMIIPVDLRPSIRTKLKGQPTEKNQWDKASAEKGEVPVTRVYPNLAQGAATAISQMAQNTSVPRAVPVQEPTGEAGLPVPQPPAGKADPEWQRALQLLEQITPNKGNSGP